MLFSPRPGIQNWTILDYCQTLQASLKAVFPSFVSFLCAEHFSKQTFGNSTLARATTTTKSYEENKLKLFFYDIFKNFATNQNNLLQVMI